MKCSGGYIQVSGCFAFSGTGDMHKRNYTLTKAKYHSILQRHAIPSSLKLCGKRSIFQQDNSLKQAVTLCQVCLKSREEQRVLTCMAFPSQSLGVNFTLTSLEIFEKAKGESFCNITRLSLRCAEKGCLNNVDSYIFQKLRI